MDEDPLPFPLDDSPPIGSTLEEGIIIPDPVEVYLNFHGELPSDFTVATTSSSIRALRINVEGQDINKEVKCILDNGSSVIAMSEALCHHLGLAYDPLIWLSMESANGGIKYTL